MKEKKRPARSSGARTSGARLIPKSRMTDKTPLEFMADDDSDAEEDEAMLDVGAAKSDFPQCVSALSTGNPAFSVVFFEGSGGAMHIRTCKGTDPSQLEAPGMKERGVSRMSQGVVTTPLKKEALVDNFPTPFNDSVPLEQWSFFRGVPSGAHASETHVPLSLVCATSSADAASRIAHAHDMRPADYNVIECGIPAPGSMMAFPG